MAVAPEDWPICLKDVHPAYVDWDEFMANRRQLVDNLNRYDTGRPGVRAKAMPYCKGSSVVGGAVGACTCVTRDRRLSGLRLLPTVALKGGQPAKCQEARALAVDAEVERLILEALTPDRIALAVAALGAIEKLRAGQWSGSGR